MLNRTLSASSQYNSIHAAVGSIPAAMTGTGSRASLYKWGFESARASAMQPHLTSHVTESAFAVPSGYVSQHAVLFQEYSLFVHVTLLGKHTSLSVF